MPSLSVSNNQPAISRESPSQEEAEFLRDAILPVGRTGGREIPRELLHQRVGVALHLAPPPCPPST